jgi:hypothetical protein
MLTLNLSPQIGLLNVTQIAPLSENGMDLLPRKVRQVSVIDYVFLVIYTILVYVHLLYRKIFSPPLKSLDNEVVLVSRTY